MKPLHDQLTDPLNDSPDREARIVANLADYINNNPAPKRSSKLMKYAPLGATLATVSAIGGLINPAATVIALSAAAIFIGTWYLSRNSSIQYRLATNAIFALAAVMTLGTTTYAAVNLPSIYGQLTGSVDAEQSTTGHKEYQFSHTTCPQYGSLSGESQSDTSRWVLKSGSNLDEQDATRAIQAQCATNAANLAAAQAGLVGENYMTDVINQVTDRTANRITLNETPTGLATTEFDLASLQLVRMDGTTASLSDLVEHQVVLPVTTVDNSQLAALVLLPADIDYAYYGSEYAKQLASVSPCIGNTDADCVSVHDGKAIIGNAIAPTADIQGRVKSVDGTTVTLEASGSKKAYRLELSQVYADLTVDTYLAVSYVAGSDKTVIAQSQISSLEIVSNSLDSNPF